VLASQKSDERFEPASLTKLMTEIQEFAKQTPATRMLLPSGSPPAARRGRARVGHGHPACRAPGWDAPGDPPSRR
jgi:cob(I)alamin adenosyltransferase